MQVLGGEVVSLGVVMGGGRFVSRPRYVSTDFVRREQILRGEALFHRGLDQKDRRVGLEVAGVCSYPINVRGFDVWREQVLGGDALT